VGIYKKGKVTVYCTPTDIEGEFKATQFTSSSAVTSNQVTDWIKQETAYINGVISLRYVTPVASTYDEAFLILKRICIYRVSERVKSKLEVKSGISQTDQEVKAINYTRTPNADLKAIVDGDLILKEVPLVSSTGAVSSWCEPDCDTSTCHTFDGSQQW
jgi:hypothetical protein